MQDSQAGLSKSEEQGRERETVTQADMSVSGALGHTGTKAWTADTDIWYYSIACVQSSCCSCSWCSRRTPCLHRLPIAIYFEQLFNSTALQFNSFFKSA